MDACRSSFLGAGGGALVLAVLVAAYLATTNLSAIDHSTGQTIAFVCVAALEAVLVIGGVVLLVLGLRRP